MIEYAIKQPKMSLYMHLACYNTTQDYAGLGFVYFRMGKVRDIFIQSRKRLTMQNVSDETSQDHRLAPARFAKLNMLISQSIFGVTENLRLQYDQDA